MTSPADKLKEATSNWQKVTDATKAEAERIRKEKEGDTTGETANQANIINATGA